jgi:hypothetical protein
MEVSEKYHAGRFRELKSTYDTLKNKTMGIKTVHELTGLQRELTPKEPSISR